MSALLYTELNKNTFNDYVKIGDKLYGKSTYKSTKIHNKKTNKDLLIKLPAMYTYGASVPKKKDNEGKDAGEEDIDKQSASSEFPKLSLTLTFSGGEYFENSKTEPILLENFTDLDEYISKEVFDNKFEKWGKKILDQKIASKLSGDKLKERIEMEKESLMAKFKRLIRHPKAKDSTGKPIEGEYDETKKLINVKLPYKYSGNKIIGYDLKIFEADSLDEEGKPVNVSKTPIYDPANITEDTPSPLSIITAGKIIPVVGIRIYNLNVDNGCFCELAQCLVIKNGSGKNEVDLDCQFDCGEKNDNTNSATLDDDANIDELEMLKHLDKNAPSSVLNVDAQNSNIAIKSPPTPPPQIQQPIEEPKHIEEISPESKYVEPAPEQPKKTLPKKPISKKK